MFNGADEAAKAETRAMTAWTLDQTLKLLHPVMPFITEELWDELGEEGAPRDEATLIGAAWPVLPDGFIDAEAEAEIGWLVDLVSEVRRSARRDERAAGGQAAADLRRAGRRRRQARLARHRDLILTLARVSERRDGRGGPGRGGDLRVGRGDGGPVAGRDHRPDGRTARLTKEIAAFDSDIGHVNKKLGNPNFVATRRARGHRRAARQAGRGRGRQGASWTRLWRGWTTLA